MKIYFAGSIRGGRDDMALYARIIALLKNYGQVLTEHLGDQKLSSYGESHMTDQEIYERDVAMVRDSDIVIAEVTQASLGVGYEIGYAESLGKKILCLYRPQEGKRLSAMLAGNSNMTVVNYSDISELSKTFDLFLK